MVRKMLAEGCVLKGCKTRNFKVNVHENCVKPGTKLRVTHDSGLVVFIDLAQACDPRDKRFYLPPTSIETYEGFADIVGACEGFIDEFNVYIASTDSFFWLKLTLLQPIAF